MTTQLNNVSIAATLLASKKADLLAFGAAAFPEDVPNKSNTVKVLRDLLLGWATDVNTSEEAIAAVFGAQVVEAKSDAAPVTPVTLPTDHMNETEAAFFAACYSEKEWSPARDAGAAVAAAADWSFTQVRDYLNACQLADHTPSPRELMALLKSMSVPSGYGNRAQLAERLKVALQAPAGDEEE